MADEADKKPIRRGRGLRLSTEATPPGDAPTAPDAQATPPSPEASAPPTTPTPAKPVDATPDAPVVRRRGMRLSTQDAGPAEAAEVSAAPAEAPAPPDADGPVVRRRGMRLSTQDAGPAEAAEVSATPLAGAPPAPVTPPAGAPVRWRVATATGPISYLAAGSGEPMLLLHGFGATARLWNATVEALGDRRSLYALDLPGFGESPPRAAPPTLPALAAEVLACADALGLARFDLLGHSLGAAVAAVLAARHPDRVGRLVAVSLGARPFAPELAAIGMSRAPLDLTLGLARPLLDMWQPFGRAVMQSPPLALTMGAMVLHAPPASPELWQGYLSDHAAADPRAYITSLAAPGDPALHAALPAIAAPTLCVAGREDRVARLAETTTAQAMIPNSRLALLDGCGHMVMIERPAAFHEAVRSFL